MNVCGRFRFGLIIKAAKTALVIKKNLITGRYHMKPKHIKTVQTFKLLQTLGIPDHIILEATDKKDIIFYI